MADTFNPVTVEIKWETNTLYVEGSDRSPVKTAYEGTIVFPSRPNSGKLPDSSVQDRTEWPQVGTKETVRLYRFGESRALFAYPVKWEVIAVGAAPGVYQVDGNVIVLGRIDSVISACREGSKIVITIEN